jgi:hypothetical protein
MLRWSAAPAIALTFLVSAAPVSAQTATVVLKSGEKHTGQNPWTRVDKGEFSLRKSQHDELRVPIDQVAYVDFGGTADSPVSLSGSQNAVVLRNGTVVKGQLVEMAHTTQNDPSTEYLVVIRDENGQEKRYPGNQVGRVYFAGGASAVNTNAQATSGSGIVVSGRQRWTSTGITVTRGQNVGFNATGEIQLSTDSNDMAGTAGSKAQRYAAGAPLPREFAGALIGRIGTNGQPFAIGNLTSVTMPAAGVLFLGVNDDALDDNQGEFRVEITPRAGNRRR